MESTENPPEKPAKKTPARWRWITWLFIILPLLGTLAMTAHTLVKPRVYESTAAIELTPPDDIPSEWGLDAFLDTEIEIIRSQVVLQSASEKLQLNERWGTEDHVTIQKLKNIIQIKRLNSGRMIQIRGVDHNAQDTSLLCKAVYEAYQNRKKELHHAHHTERLRELKQLKANTQDQVYELSKRYRDIMEKVSRMSGDPATLQGGTMEAEFAKRELDQGIEKLTAIETIYDSGLRKLQIPVSFFVVHETPVQPIHPIKHDVAGALLGGFIFGAFIAGLISLLILMLSFARR
ncbi:MAG: hypothetical protein ACPG32_08290 [Akkermansiaceae bacterium]